MDALVRQILACARADKRLVGDVLAFLSSHSDAAPIWALEDRREGSTVRVRAVPTARSRAFLADLQRRCASAPAAPAARGVA